jgi:hypothetical protein
VTNGGIPKVYPESAFSGEVTVEEGADNGGIPKVDAASAIGGTVAINEPTWAQRMGLYLLIGVGALIAIVILTAGASWLWDAPTMPARLPDNEEAARAVIEGYKSASTAPQQLLTGVVVNGLLPVFTLLLGYVFGARQVGP